MTTTEHAAYLLAARRERARRWAASPDMRGYPALAAEDETEESLVAAPAEKAERKPKPSTEREAAA
jgi:hypothetical protein